MSPSSVNSSANVNQQNRLESINTPFKKTENASQEKPDSALKSCDSFIKLVNEENKIAIGATVKKYDFVGSGKESGTLGIRAEIEDKLIKAGPVSYSNIIAFGLNAGSDGANIDTGIGGKISAGNESASIYGSLMGTANAGFLNGPTIGIGYRAAIGVEINNTFDDGTPYSTYIEASKENATNYENIGIGIGLKARM